MEELEIVRCARIEGVRMFFNCMDYRTNHFHEEWEILMPVDQSMIYTTATEKKRVHPGDMLLFPPYRNHSIQKEGKGVTFLCLQISPDLFPSCPELRSVITKSTTIRECFTPEEYCQLQKLLFHAMDIYLNLKPFDELKFMADVATILSMIFEHVPYDALSSEKINAVQKKSERLVRFKEFVDKNYRYKIKLADFAREEGCSLSYMSAFIKEGMNTSFRDYVSQVRFFAALKMMNQTSLSLQEICSECGFSDYRYFSSIFVEQTGMTPKEYWNHPFDLGDSSIHVHHSIHSLERFFTLEESRRMIQRYRQIGETCFTGDEGLENQSVETAYSESLNEASPALS